MRFNGSFGPAVVLACNRGMRPQIASAPLQESMRPGVPACNSYMQSQSPSVHSLKCLLSAGHPWFFDWELSGVSAILQPPCAFWCTTFTYTSAILHVQRWPVYLSNRDRAFMPRDGKQKRLMTLRTIHSEVDLVLHLASSWIRGHGSTVSISR